MRAWQPLADIAKPQKVIPAMVEFVDIAGLVAGASKGEGLGNKFLANIRETDAIAHVVRCFVDDNVVHVAGQDRSGVRHRNHQYRARAGRSGDGRKGDAARRQDRQGRRQGSDRASGALLEKVRAQLNEGKPVRALELDEGRQSRC